MVKVTKEQPEYVPEEQPFVRPEVTDVSGESSNVKN